MKVSPGGSFAPLDPSLPLFPCPLAHSCSRQPLASHAPLPPYPFEGQISLGQLQEPHATLGALGSLRQPQEPWVALRASEALVGHASLPLMRGLRGKGARGARVLSLNEGPRLPKVPKAAKGSQGFLRSMRPQGDLGKQGVTGQGEQGEQWEQGPRV